MTAPLNTAALEAAAKAGEALVWKMADDTSIADARTDLTRTIVSAYLAALPAGTPSREDVARALFRQSIYLGYNDDAKAREWERTKGLHYASADAILSLFQRHGAAAIRALDPKEGV